MPPEVSIIHSERFKVRIIIRMEGTEQIVNGNSMIISYHSRRTMSRRLAANYIC